MSIELPHDPRTALVRTKYFSLHPKPLERWLWRQGLPQAAERVFWLHWEEGMRSGDWCSEIPIKRVARECSIDPSTVTRAYQLLKSLGLLRREDPGRDPSNPFQQATAITEVRLPRDLLTELSSAPNRPSSARQPAETPPNANPSAPPVATPSAGTPGGGLEIGRLSAPDTCRRQTREETRLMWSRASAAEQTRYYAASRDRLTALEFDPDTKLTPVDRGQILAQLAQLAAAKPINLPTPQSSNRTSKPEYAGPHRLSVLELARARKQILDLVPAADANEVLRQVIWSVEEGALRRFTSTMALNIALKKIREGAWSKPNRMPPNWLPHSPRPKRALPEHCNAA